MGPSNACLTLSYDADSESLRSVVTTSPDDHTSICVAFTSAKSAIWVSFWGHFA